MTNPYTVGNPINLDSWPVEFGWVLLFNRIDRKFENPSRMYSVHIAISIVTRDPAFLTVYRYKRYMVVSPKFEHLDQSSDVFLSS